MKRNKILDKKTAQVEITSGAGRFRFLNGLLDEVKRERTNPE